MEIKYAVLQEGEVRLQILDKAGHVLRVLFSGYQQKGSHIYLFKPADWYLAPGAYQYRLQSGGQVFQREIRV